MDARSTCVAFLIACAIGALPCDAAPTPEMVRWLSGCYSRVDSLRYNTFKVHLRPDGTYYAELQGDIALWWTSTGTWDSDGSAVFFSATQTDHDGSLPPRLGIGGAIRHVRLRVPEQGQPQPAGRFDPLLAMACDQVGWAGTYDNRKGAPPPIPDGEYTFEHRFAEHPTMPGVPMQVRFHEGRVVVTNTTPATPFPVGVVAQGLLRWNTRNGHWIIAEREADVDATEIGGCTDGPEILDLEKRIYWTC